MTCGLVEHTHHICFLTMTSTMTLSLETASNVAIRWTNI
jgi:hypothetical protein